MQQFSRRPKEKSVCIRMDITVDLPEELANEAERLGICRFDECIYDEKTKRMTASVTTKFYQIRKGA
ncbi:hypothetical protein H8790_11565 [Oscillibacter hominis]|uniref:Uncharacterized protein n=1 Tax=Oscillibacter hominis TaxID=2763056 RepID=A0A7G9B3D9_9FIRM|nr:hypothetical protein [Oscillibacter hominis]QNL44070.1 hypothetical protein H8790_11565 [Oscillibacter hominis]